MTSRADYEIFDLGDFTLSGGATLRGARLAYQTYGTLSDNRDNAIVYPTWYSGRHWENEWLIGDGMALDPARYFVIVPNMLGNGLSSSPSNTPAPYNGPRFPDVRVQDNVRAQHTYPLLLPANAALELPGAAAHPGYPLALAVSAVFASIRADSAGAEELCRRAADANGRRDPPDWRVEEAIYAARQNIANTRGAFADAARLAEQAARLARAGGDLADASIELTIAAAGHVLAGGDPGAVALASEALALACQAGAPALTATALLAVGVAVGGTDPGQARACLRESREISTELGYHSAIDLVWATAIAYRTHDRTGTLELGSHAIRGLQHGGDRLRMAMVLHMVADALAATRPAPAAIIHGAADTYTVPPPNPARPTSPTVPAEPGEQPVRELRARGAGMDWDQALAYTLAQTTQALNEPGSDTQP